MRVFEERSELALDLLILRRLLGLLAVRLPGFGERGAAGVAQGVADLHRRHVEDQRPHRDQQDDRGGDPDERIGEQGDVVTNHVPDEGGTLPADAQ